MPVVVQLRAHQRLDFRRAVPQILVDVRRPRRFLGHFADARTAFVAKGAGVFHFAERIGFQPGQRIGEPDSAAALHAHLHDPLVGVGGLHELTAFPDIVRDGLFDIHILAGLTAPDGRERVPVIRRGDRDGIDLLALQQLADVLIRRHVRALFQKLRLALFEHLRIHVAERHEPHAFHFEVFRNVIFAAPVEADDGDADVVIRAGRLRADAGGEREGGGGGDGGFEKGAALHEVVWELRNERPVKMTGDE